MMLTTAATLGMELAAGDMQDAFFATAVMLIVLLFFLSKVFSL